MLKLLTLLYIGGASSSAALMRCQHTDGGAWTVAACSVLVVLVSLIFDSFARNAGKEPLPDKHAFRSALPDIKCQDAAPLVARWQVLHSVKRSCQACRSRVCWVPSVVTMISSRIYTIRSENRACMAQP